jgi:YD repeat-containing protein
VLTKNVDGTFTLRAKDGRTTTFVTPMPWVAVPGQIADANGNTVTITRDWITNPVSITDATGRGLTTTWVASPAARLVRVADSSGRTVSYDYEPTRNLLTAVTNPAGGVTQYTYDSQARMTSITDARGITYLTNTYDANSRVCQQSQADSGVFTMHYVTADIATAPASVQFLSEAASGARSRRPRAARALRAARWWPRCSSIPATTRRRIGSARPGS